MLIVNKSKTAMYNLIKILSQQFNHDEEIDYIIIDHSN